MWKSYQWYISLRNGTVPRGSRTDHSVEGRAAAADTVAGRQPSKAASTAVHHGVAERTSRRAVQKKVGGEVGVEEILEDVLCHEERIAGLVVGMQL